MKIYLASSWRNESQPVLLQSLRDAGYEVYDFRNPSATDNGFSWRSIDPNWQDWTAEDYIKALSESLAQKGFKNDFDAMKSADVCVLLLPCGRSAHLELGYMCGAGKKTIIVTQDGEEPELMALMCDAIVCSWSRLFITLHDMKANLK